MKKHTSTILAIAVLAGLSSAANASSFFFNFAAFSNSNLGYAELGSSGSASGPTGEGSVSASDPFSVSDGTFTVWAAATASNSVNNSTVYPYLDAGGGDAYIIGNGGANYAAGLGVCQSSSCAGNSDDNVDGGGVTNNAEILSLAFTHNLTSQYVLDITQLVFRDADHHIGFDSATEGASDPEIYIRLNGGAWDTYELANNFFPANTASAFEDITTIDFRFKAGEFYLSGLGMDFRDGPNVVTPIPAAAWLFASALGVFGYLGKRKAAA